MSTNENSNAHGEGATRRDFLHVATAGVGAVGAAAAVWPFIDSMNPAADTLAAGTVEVPLDSIAEGESIIVKWRGKPVFIRHRTAEEIARATAENSAADLKDIELDADRVKKGQEKWLVVLGVCTHLGCVPNISKVDAMEGDHVGWYCPCHGSHYDISGRIRKGPAPKNLEVPEYTFLSDTVIKIG